MDGENLVTRTAIRENEKGEASHNILYISCDSNRDVGLYMPQARACSSTRIVLWFFFYFLEKQQECLRIEMVMSR